MSYLSSKLKTACLFAPKVQTEVGSLGANEQALAGCSRYGDILVSENCMHRERVHRHLVCDDRLAVSATLGCRRRLSVWRRVLRNKREETRLHRGSFDGWASAFLLLHCILRCPGWSSVLPQITALATNLEMASDEGPYSRFSHIELSYSAPFCRERRHHL